MDRQKLVKKLMGNHIKPNDVFFCTLCKNKVKQSELIFEIKRAYKGLNCPYCTTRGKFVILKNK